jgi:hypothetical protein
MFLRVNFQKESELTQLFDAKTIIQVLVDLSDVNANLP